MRIAPLRPTALRSLSVLACLAGLLPAALAAAPIHAPGPTAPTADPGRAPQQPAGVAPGDGNWTLYSNLQPRPFARSGHTAILDAANNRMVVFGGDSGTNPLGDVWALSLTGSPVWTELAPAGTPPPPTRYHTAIYDALGQRMIVFGGLGATDPVNSVWQLTLDATPTWSQLSPAGAPPSARSLHAAAYDPFRQRMLVVAGLGESNVLNDVWELTLDASPTWRLIPTTGPTPPARCQHTIQLPAGGQFLQMQGGLGAAGTMADYWVLFDAGGPDPVWSDRSPDALPSPRRLGTIFRTTEIPHYFGTLSGIGFGGLTEDGGLLGLFGWFMPDPTPTGTAPSNRYAATTILDGSKNKLVVFGGVDAAGPASDLGILDWTVTTAVPGDLAGLGFALAIPHPNPARDRTVMEFELGEPGRVVLEVFDPQGRRLRRLVDGAFDAGRHTAAWAGDDEANHPVGTGVYFVRMQVGGRHVIRRTVRLH